MAYQFQLGKLKLPDGASIDTVSGDIELGNKQVDATDLNVDDAKLNFAELIFNYSVASNHTADNAGEGGDLTFIIDSKHYKIQFSDASDTAGFTSGNGAGSGTAFTMNVDTVAAGRDISALCDAVVTGLLDNTNGLAAKVGGSAKYSISKITTGSNANKEVSIRSSKAGATYDFSSVSKGSISSMNAPTAIAYSQVTLFNMSTDDVFATKTAAEVAAALPIMSNNNPSFTGTLTVGSAELSEAELEILDGATVTTAELNYLSNASSNIQTQITANDGDIADILSFAGRADGEVNMGTYTGSTITDNQNIKQNLQQLETAVESKQPTISVSSRLNANLIHDGSVSNTEFGYLDGVTSAIQTQLNSAAMTKANLTSLAATYDGTETLVFGDAGNDMTFQIKGNLIVDGTTTTINSTTLTVDDKDLVLASGAANSSAADGAGITIDGASASILYSHSGTKFAINKPIDVTGKMVTSAGLEIGNGGTIGAGNDADMLTLNQGSDVTVQAGVELRVGANRLKIDGTAVTATAAELNAIDKSRKFQALTTSTTIVPSNGHIVVLVPTDAAQTFTLPEITSSLEGMVLRIKNASNSNLTTLAKNGSNPANCLEGADSVVLDPGSAISCIAIDTGTDAFEWVIM